MHVHRTLFDVDMVAPHAVEQLCAAVHALCTRHKVIQQLEFHGAELEQLVFKVNPVRRRVQAQATDLQGHSGRFRHLAPQDCAGTRQQLLGRERLGDVVIGPGVQPGHAVGLVAACGEHDQGNILRARVRPPAPGQSPRRGSGSSSRSAAGRTRTCQASRLLPR